MFRRSCTVRFRPYQHCCFGLILLLSQRAWAHHAEGGTMSDTFAAAFMSGLAHPVIGMDHLLASLLIGWISFSITQRRLDPALFLGASLLGCLAHVTFGSLPATELGVALTLPVLLAALWNRSPWTGWSWLLMIVGGTLHGYAYGTSIVGVGSQSLVAYLLGLALIQGILTYSFGLLTNNLASKNPQILATLKYSMTIVTGAAALVFIVGAIR